ncbi:MAG: hypothetical protein K9G62_00710 [Alphaproteobacteria bacterium]|nr:hypothetical protein [Alphaproteobacteria bacterium]
MNKDFLTDLFEVHSQHYEYLKTLGSKDPAMADHLAPARLAALDTCLRFQVEMHRMSVMEKSRDKNVSDESFQMDLKILEKMDKLLKIESPPFYFGLC